MRNINLFYNIMKSCHHKKLVFRHCVDLEDSTIRLEQFFREGSKYVSAYISH